MLGRVVDDELDTLYAHARALLLPSQLEGFGFTPCEALVRATPAIVSDLPILRAGLGDAATYVPVGDEEAWVAALPHEDLPAPPFAALAWADAGRARAARGVRQRRALGGCSRAAGGAEERAQLVLRLAVGALAHRVHGERALIEHLLLVDRDPPLPAGDRFARAAPRADPQADRGGDHAVLAKRARVIVNYVCIPESEVVVPAVVPSSRGGTPF